MSTDEQPQCSSEPEIEVGNLVAVDLPQYEEWPQIGKVLHVTKANIEYWTETIPLVSVILANVKLTRSCRLQKSTIAHLKVYTRNSTME